MMDGDDDNDDDYHFSLTLRVSFAQGSVDQLREVWEETDGLDPQEFNPKTFFKLHGKKKKRQTSALETSGSVQTHSSVMTKQKLYH